MTEDEARVLVHELEVHRIELEMQNEELKRAQTEAQEHYERFQDLYDFAPISYLTLDVEGKIVGANLTAATYFGIDRGTLLTLPFSAFLLHPSRHEFLTFIREAVASDTRQRCEVRLKVKGQGNCHAIVEGIKAAASGAKNEVSIAITDITELRRTEKALRSLNEELETRVRERTAELREKDRMLLLQSRQAAMGEMIGNIAHQWRQPLIALELFIRDVKACHESGQFTGEYLDSFVARSLRAIHQMSQTIDDFMNFLKPNKAKVPFTPREAVEKALSFMEWGAGRPTITFDCDEGGDVPVTGFLNEYTQVLLNILQNARDALAERDIAAPAVRIRAFGENGRSVVTVADNAGGIPEEVMARVFDPYFTTKEEGKGTGIGLYMSRMIIERNMGGRLTVRNTGDGAEFRIEV